MRAPRLAVALLLTLAAPVIAQESPSALELAYQACERNLIRVCDSVTCLAVCGHREGVYGCADPYLWPECDDIAKRWFASVEQTRQVEAQRAEQAREVEADHKLVRRAARDASPR